MRFTHKKRHRPTPASEVVEEPPVSMARVVPAQVLRNNVLDVEELLADLPRQLSHPQLARLLWSADYWPIFVQTLGQFADVSAPMAAVFMQVRGQSRGEVDRATVMRLVSSVASLVQGEQSNRTLPFPMVAKSISFLMQRVPTRVWTVERKLRHLLSVSVLRGVLRCMVECIPPPVWEISGYVSFAYVDQTYRQRGVQSNRQRVEYFDSANLPLRIEREVVLNGASFPCPAALFPQLDAAARAEIAADGVYRQPFTNVQQYLTEPAIRRNLSEFAIYSLSRIRQRALMHNVRIQHLSNHELMDELLGRGNKDPGGSSHYNILPTCRECDTKSYMDGFKANDHLLKHVGPTLVRRVGGDGQWVLLLSYLKARFPDRFKNVLIDSGDFHAFAHFMFALIELFWKVCACCFGGILQLENVFERMPNLENNAYSHALVFLSSCSLAIVIYFTRHITSPSPDLFYTNPLAYYQLLNSAGGRVLFLFYYYVCSPVLAYQRAIRDREGPMLPKLQAYALHVHRCVHKPNESKINLIALISFYCIHPALKLFKTVMCGISILGRLSSCMAFDRLIEWINFRQGQRNSSFQAYDHSLQYTPELQPMMHVDAAYTAATLGKSPEADDGYDRRILNNALRLVERFIQQCGTDLTVASTDNPWWHTGNPVALTANSAREMRPWDYFWAVLRGTAAGKMMAHAQSGHDYVNDHLENHFFKM